MIGAHEFFTETPPDRIVGYEVEQDVAELAYPADKGSIFNSEAVTIGVGRLITEQALKAAGVKTLVPMEAKDNRHWLDDGGLLYLDVGRVEYASPECLGPKQATASMKASEKKMVPIVQNFIDTNPGYDIELYRRTGIVGMSGDIITMANHNSLSVPVTEIETPRRYLIASLLPLHLATENWAWAGMVAPDGYSLSQKVHGINGASVEFQAPYSSHRALNNKPMVSFRGAGRGTDDTYADGFERIEVRCSDYSPSEWANFAHWGSMSLILRLSEHPQFITPKLRAICHSIDPVRAMHVVSADESLRQPLCVVGNRRYSAVHIQSALIEAVTDLSEHVQLPDDEVAALEIWQHIVDAMHMAAKNGREAIHHLVSWSAKLDILDAKIGREKITSRNPKALRLCMAWDRTVPEGIGSRYMQLVAKEQGIDPLHSDEEIAALIDAPPQNTRAKHRVAFAKKAGNMLWTIGWAGGSRTKQSGNTVWPLYADYDKPGASRPE